MKVTGWGGNVNTQCERGEIGLQRNYRLEERGDQEANTGSRAWKRKEKGRSIR